MYKTEVKAELSFAGEKLVRNRHKIHPYPAMLHPLLVDYLLASFAKPNNIIFDPFCGSGVTLLQSVEKGYDSVGFDINPLALLIAKTKTARYAHDELIAEYVDLKHKILTGKDVDVPSIKNIDYWFTDEVIHDLGRIRYELLNNRYKYKNFFIVAFAYICRDQSLTRKGEFKRYRMKGEKIEGFQNQVFDKYFKHLQAMIAVFAVETDVVGKSKPLLANSENEIPEDIRYDLVITSPPYGDSRTTVAYGEFSSFGHEWINGLNDFGEVDYRIDSEGLGKKGDVEQKIFNHSDLKDVLDSISAEDQKRAEDVQNFFNGYYKAIRNISKNLSAGGTACFVVGNRTVKGKQIPMDKITASFFGDFGLRLENVFVRDILNKVMPSKNSPTNKTGATKNTMMNEYIVIMKKPL